MSDDSIATLAEVYEFLSVSGSDDDDLIQNFIDRKTVEFENWCQLDSFYVTDYTEYHDGEGAPYLFVRNFPINSIAEIASDSDWTWGTDTVIDSDDYRVVEKNYVAYKSYFNPGLQNIKVTYNAGYDSIPLDLKEALIEEVSRLYNRRKDIDVFIKTLQDGSQHRIPSGFMPNTKIILSKYKRMRAL